MHRIAYFKGEAYLIIFGVAALFSGSAGVVLVGLALIAGTGYFAWQKWQRMDEEARQRSARARDAVSYQAQGPPQSGVARASIPREPSRELSVADRRVAEALSALGVVAYGDIGEDLTMDPVRVLESLRYLCDAGFAVPQGGGVYALIDIARETSRPAAAQGKYEDEDRLGLPEISMDAWDSLDVIVNSDGATFWEIAAYLSFPVTRVSPAVKELGSEGLVEAHEAGVFRPTVAGARAIAVFQDASAVASDSTGSTLVTGRLQMCPRCDVQLLGDEAFCPECGGHVGPKSEDPTAAELSEDERSNPNSCSACGAEHSKDTRFCGDCGTPV